MVDNSHDDYLYKGYEDLTPNDFAKLREDAKQLRLVMGLGYEKFGKMVDQSQQGYANFEKGESKSMHAPKAWWLQELLKWAKAQQAKGVRPDFDEFMRGVKVSGFKAMPELPAPKSFSEGSFENEIMQFAMAVTDPDAPADLRKQRFRDWIGRASSHMDYYIKRIA